MSDMIPDTKLIYQTGGIDIPDDPSFPWKMYAIFDPPEFMGFAFRLLHGESENIIVRGMTLEALNKLIKTNRLKTHRRLRRIEITGPDGYSELFEVGKKDAGEAQCS